MPNNDVIDAQRRLLINSLKIGVQACTDVAEGTANLKEFITGRAYIHLRQAGRYFADAKGQLLACIKELEND